MEDIFQSEWMISIIGGTISTVVGGIILAIINGAGSYRRPNSFEAGVQALFKLLLYGLSMVFITGVMIYTHGSVTADGTGLFPLPKEMTDLLFVVGWMFVAVLFFGTIFLGWRSPD